MSEQSTDNSSASLSTFGKKVTPFRCLVGATISGGLSVALYFLMSSIVQTYAGKTITSTNPIVINITVAVRTLVIGIAALGTGVFGLVAIGLILLAIQVTIQGIKQRFSSNG